MVGAETVAGRPTRPIPSRGGDFPRLAAEDYYLIDLTSIYYFRFTKRENYKYHFTKVVTMAKKKKIPSKVRVTNTRKLIVSEEDRRKLDEFYNAANALMRDIALVVEKRKYPNKMVVQKYFYHFWRQKYLTLPSQVIINCIDKVIEAFRASWESCNPLPKFEELPVRLARNRSYYLYEDGTVRITVGSGKNNGVTGVVRNLTYPVELASGAELMRRGEEYYLAISFVKEFETYAPEFAIGIDFNTDAYCVAVLDKNGNLVDHKFFPHKFLGIVEYWSNKNRRRARRKLGNALENHYKMVVSGICKYILQYPRSFVFIEELDSINQKAAMLCSDKLSRNKYHTIPFRKAYDHLRGKLLWNNVFVDEVYAYGTSTMCSRCGEKGERKGKEFVCGTCGRMHADLNASINIALRGIKKWKRKFANSSP